MCWPVRRHWANGSRKARGQRKTSKRNDDTVNSFNISFNYSSMGPMIHCTALATEVQKTARISAAPLLHSSSTLVNNSETPYAGAKPTRPFARTERHRGQYLNMNSRAQLGICNNYASKEGCENNGTPPCSCLSRETKWETPRSFCIVIATRLAWRTLLI